jgi:hypothetical protein
MLLSSPILMGKKGKVDPVRDQLSTRPRRCLRSGGIALPYFTFALGEASLPGRFTLEEITAVHTG